jgi:UDP-N-acetylmuramyl pentapeptide phosphotransferase/UDP-N-acetylglucosamine-1-phosphate transferase
MNLRQSPYAQIAQVLLRYLNPQDARWLYVIVGFCVALTVLGGVYADQWDVMALVRGVIGTIIFTLQFVGEYAFITLMCLNRPVVSRLVPRYVHVLRCSALAVWLCVCVITGLVALGSGNSPGESLTLSIVAGASMLLISTPLRWPVR